jgi:hypothetical protein
MRPSRLSHRSILIALGTNAAVGAVLGVNDSTVSYWRSRGIPPVYWPKLTRLAAELGIVLTVEDLEASSPSAKLRRLCAA